jgi:hypothetical protein
MADHDPHHLFQATEGLRGIVADVTIRPNDPVSVEQAIAHMQAAIDERGEALGDNVVAKFMAEDAKRHFEELIRRRVAELRESNNARSTSADEA